MRRPARREKPFPVVGLIVAAACMLAVFAAYFLVKSPRRAHTVAAKPKRRPGGRVVGTRVTASGRTEVILEQANELPAPAPAERAGSGRPSPQAPMTVRFSSEKRGDKASEWRLVAQCPKCGKEATPWMTQMCACGQALTWPAEVTCPFCGGESTCPSCRGEETVCKHCQGRAKRSMMGIAIEQCGFCEGTGKCMTCKGSGKCPKCEGTGKIVPSRMNP